MAADSGSPVHHLRPKTEGNGLFDGIKAVVFYMVMVCILLLPHLSAAEEGPPASSDSPLTSIDVAVMYDFVPFSYVEEGTHKGFVADLLRLMAEKSGVRINARIGDWSDNLERLRQKRIDAIADISFKPERTSYTLYTTPYYEIPIAVFTDKSFGRYRELADLSGKRVGVLDDIFYLAELRQLEDIRIQTFNDYEQLTRAIALGEIDVGLQNLTSGLHYAAKNAYSNLHVAGEFRVRNLGREDLRFGIRTDRPDIQALLQTTLDSITDAQWQTLKQRWLGITPANMMDNGNSLTLTPEEREFVRKNPVIRIQNETNYEPYNFYQDGVPRGHSIDLMRLLAKKAGLKAEFVSGYSWQEYLQMIRQGDLDVIANIAQSEQRQQYLRFTSPYLRQVQGIYYNEGQTAVNTLQRLMSVSIAVPEGFFIYDRLMADKRFNVIPTRDSLESLVKVSTGEADAAIESMAVAEHLMHKYSIPGMTVASPPQIETTAPLSLRLAVSRDNPVLHQILQKAINNLSEQEMRRLQYKWTVSLDESRRYLHLTGKELAWIENRAAVRVCTLKNSLPYSQVSEDERHLGAFADLLNIMRNRSGLNMRLVPVKTDRDALQQLQAGRCDLVSRAVYDGQKADVRLSQPLLQVPLVLATGLEAVYINNPQQQLRSETLAVLEGSHVQAYMEQEYPDLKLKTFPNRTAALDAVAEGQVFAVADTLPALSRLIAKNHRDDLKISGELADTYPIRLATRNEDAILLQIVNKAIQSITPAQFEKASQKWLQAPVLTEPADYRLVKQVGIGSALLLGLFFFWNRKLAKLNAEIHSSRDQLMQVHEELKSKNRMLEQLSITDPLTRLKNRLYLDSQVDLLIAEARQHHDNLSLILIDLDHFKRVNDRFGHHIGDAVLKDFATILQQAGRDRDIVARWGGEEFLMVCPETDRYQAESLADALLSQIRQHSFEQVGQCTASIGIAYWQPGDDYESLYRRADSALYRAKNSGRDSACTAAPSEHNQETETYSE